MICGFFFTLGIIVEYVHVYTQKSFYIVKRTRNILVWVFIYSISTHTYITYSNIHTNRATSYCQMYAFDKYFPISIFLCAAVSFFVCSSNSYQICFVCGVLQIKSNMFGKSEVFWMYTYSVGTS